MAGLLDWLTEGIGSNIGGAPPAPGMPPTPPMQQETMSSVARPNPDGLSPPMPPTIGDGGPPMPSLPPTPPPMPPAADGSDGDVLPSAATATGGALPTAPPPASGGPNNMISRALGLDRNTARTVTGSLASGLKSVGENVHKPGLAAFAGSAGSALEGGNTAENKIGDEQTKYLTQAITAAQAGNTAALNVARTKLALAQAKTEEAKDGKPDKASVMNSQEQLYLRGLGAVNQDPKVKASLAKLRSVQTQFGPDSKEAKAAMTAHNDLIDGAKKQVFGTLGVNEKDAAKIGKQPGFAADNPVPAAGLTKEKFDKLPVGAYFINPKDQRLLIKQPPAGANPAAAAQSAAPAAPPPVPVTAPAGSAADREDDE